MTARHVRRRHEWLRRRALRGLRRPLPLRLLAGNADSATPGRSKSEIKAMILAMASACDVFGVVEAFDVRVAQILGPDWQVVQYGTLGHEDAGCALAVRRSRGQIVEHRLRAGIMPWLGRRRAVNMRARKWLRAKIVFDPRTPHAWSLPVSVGHPPPLRNRFLWLPFMARAPRGALVMDANHTPRAVRSRFPGRRVRMVELMAIILPRWVAASPARRVPVGGDHPAAVSTLWPTACLPTS